MYGTKRLGPFACFPLGEVRRKTISPQKGAIRPRRGEGHAKWTGHCRFADKNQNRRMSGQPPTRRRILPLRIGQDARDIRQALFQTSPSPFERNEIDSKRQSVRQDLVDADRSSPTFDFAHESRAKAKHFGNLFLRIPQRFSSLSQQWAKGSALHNPCSARHDLVATDCHHCSILAYRC